MESLEEIQKKLQTNIPGAKLRLEGNSLVVDRSSLIDVCRFLKENDALKMDYVSCMTGVDYREYLECVYHLYSISRKQGPICLKVRVKLGDPKIPSLVPIYRGAEFQEREAYDMVGIIFEGHPDLRRILMWDGFAHYPLRKSYVPEDQDVLDENKENTNNQITNTK